MVETVIGSDMMQALALAPLQADQVKLALANAGMPILAIDTNFDGAQTFIGTAHEDGENRQRRQGCGARKYPG